MLTGPELGAAIASAIEKKGVSKVAVAAWFGVKPPSIQDWIRRGTISKEKLPLLWEYFAEVAGPDHWGLASFPHGGKHTIAALGSAGRMPPPQRGEVVIREYNTGGKMGDGLVLKEQPGVIQSWQVSEEWVRKNVPYYTAVGNLAIVTGFGDSMLGMFNPGDPLLVDTGITKADVDGVYFFRVGDEGFIKRLQRIPGEGIVVISENHKYRDWTIKKGMDFQVFAKVLKAWRGENL
ncbi:MAG: S24 family peptidase [Pseudomonadota bacterium]